jgi:hypothetical protein
MSENGTVAATEELDAGATKETSADAVGQKYSNAEKISYHSVEKEGKVTAIWEMQGRLHLRTIDPRSSEGKKILSLFETAG